MSQHTPYEVIIGLEVHAQLLTRSKMFCPCPANYSGAEPNTTVCPVCLGMPGVLPVINRQAVEYAVMVALALNCTIAEYTKFDRKNYPYPDLMKGYQISQYDAPLSRHGWLALEVNGEVKGIGITRVHLEEDTAKLLHPQGRGEGYSLVDVNRSGVPLLEIVGEPDLRSPEEARRYLMKLRAILQYLGVSTGSMEEGSFRCDANISLRPWGQKALSPKVEVKNMNSFKAVYRALEYEVERQSRVLKEGGRIHQETRGWVDEKGSTVSQRTKEYAHDYRYFPEPDLPPLTFSREWVESLRSRLSELPDARRERFVSQYGLPGYDAGLLTSSKAMADFFEACLEGVRDNLPQKAKAVSNWLLGEFSRLLNLSGMEVEQAPLHSQHLMELLGMVERGVLSGPSAKEVFEEMFRSGKGAREVVGEKGLVQISDEDTLAAIVTQVLSENPQAVADYLQGKKQAMTFLVGKVMRATRGRANPALASRLLQQRLEGQAS